MSEYDAQMDMQAKIQLLTRERDEARAKCWRLLAVAEAAKVFSECEPNDIPRVMLTWGVLKEKLAALDAASPKPSVEKTARQYPALMRRLADGTDTNAAAGGK